MAPAALLPTMEQFAAEFDAFGLEKSSTASNTFDPFADSSDSFAGPEDSFAAGSFSASNPESTDEDLWGDESQDLPSRKSGSAVLLAPSSQDTSTISRGRRSNSSSKLQTVADPLAGSSTHTPPRSRSNSRKRISKSRASRQARLSPHRNSGQSRKVFPQNVPRNAPPRRSSLGTLTTTSPRDRFSDLVAVPLTEKEELLSTKRNSEGTRRRINNSQAKSSRAAGRLSSGTYHGAATTTTSKSSKEGTSSRRSTKEESLLSASYHGTSSKTKDAISSLAATYHGPMSNSKTKDAVSILAGPHHGTTDTNSPKEMVSPKNVGRGSRRSISPVPQPRSPRKETEFKYTPTQTRSGENDSTTTPKSQRRKEKEFKYSPTPKKSGDDTSTKTPLGRTSRKEKEFKYSPTPKTKGTEDDSLSSSRHAARRNRRSAINRARLGHDMLVRNMDQIGTTTTTNKNNKDVAEEQEMVATKDGNAVWQNRRRRHQEQSS